MVVSPDVFESHIYALSSAGFEGVSSFQVLDFVLFGTPLPDNPVWITFDDGYLSNFTYAYPVLKRHNMRATVFVIGRSRGWETFNNDGRPIFSPHFSWEQAAEMSWLVDIQSHSHDMHQVVHFDGENARQTAQRKEGEAESDFIYAFRADITRARDDILTYVGSPLVAYSYPHGDASLLTDVLLREMGVYVTLSIVQGGNTIVAGLPQSLLQLNRLTVYGTMSGQDVLDLLEGGR